MLQLGSSKPWPIAMEAITGQRTMSASAILEYFKPLREWLEAKNKELNVNVGWEKSDSKFSYYHIKYLLIINFISEFSC
jgi:peptidyl-dipeptidase A